MATCGRSHVAQPCDRGSVLRFADSCSARIRWVCRAIERGEFSNNEDENDDSDDVADDNGAGDNVADDNAGGESMLNDMTVAPNMNTPLEAVSGIVGAVGGAKGNSERSCAAG